MSVCNRQCSQRAHGNSVKCHSEWTWYYKWNGEHALHPLVEWKRPRNAWSHQTSWRSGDHLYDLITLCSLEPWRVGDGLSGYTASQPRFRYQTSFVNVISSCPHNFKPFEYLISTYFPDMATPVGPFHTSVNHTFESTRNPTPLIPEKRGQVSAGLCPVFIQSELGWTLGWRPRNACEGSREQVDWFLHPDTHQWKAHCFPSLWSGVISDAAVCLRDSKTRTLDDGAR